MERCMQGLPPPYTLLFYGLLPLRLGLRKVTGSFASHLPLPPEMPPHLSHPDMTNRPDGERNTKEEGEKRNKNCKGWDWEGQIRLRLPDRVGTRH